jgi:ribosomal protein S18 acetylase RimI-like enzyme
MIVTRAYTGINDLEKMQRLVAEARGEIARTHYLHQGDLVWQLHHMHAGENTTDLIQLWEDAHGNLLGFALMFPKYGWFELQVKPTQRGALEAEILHWVEARFRQITVKQGGEFHLYTLVNEHDQQRQALLEKIGFVKGDVWHYLARPLTEPILPSQLLDSFIIRSVRNESEVEARAQLLASAFGGVPDSEKYRQFMRSPFYDSALDLVAVSPNGELAAFAQLWLDSISKQGQFEPVGTSPDFRRLGLGSAVLLEGMNLMRERGMALAFVVVEGADQAAVQLYHSVGLSPRWDLHIYGK